MNSKSWKPFKYSLIAIYNWIPPPCPSEKIMQISAWILSTTCVCITSLICQTCPYIHHYVLWRGLKARLPSRHYPDLHYISSTRHKQCYSEFKAIFRKSSPLLYLSKLPFCVLWIALAFGFKVMSAMLKWSFFFAVLTVALFVCFDTSIGGLLLVFTCNFTLIFTK